MAEVKCHHITFFYTFTCSFANVLIRFTSVRVSAKYHGIKLEYRELRHTVLDLLGQIRTKLRVWGRPFISPEAVRVLMQEWHVSSNSVLHFIGSSTNLSFILKTLKRVALYLSDLFNIPAASSIYDDVRSMSCACAEESDIILS